MLSVQPGIYSGVCKGTKPGYYVGHNRVDTGVHADLITYQVLLSTPLKHFIPAAGVDEALLILDTGYAFGTGEIMRGVASG